ncbi:MAG: methylated-DNA--[protein]-cysteine S-methyltransferase [Candidatus Dadabacteria bacterium]|nr:methylated-DNA--[protein]-cysteine S-methyltransferase [Candidatus Dadabacteria bacterium]TDI90259.1 MAG: methylated-DNA--[protein]-cysteine S-methyltransferase [Candidatus Dadabacteria bacterium]TDJ00746.1 MAG: methylated-DNA--[protein]-cysteine S-methyltransferase [Candidatus Dadabacteria bacterium]
MSHVNYSSTESEFGTIYVVSSPKGISRIVIGKNAFLDFLHSTNGTRAIEGGDAEKLTDEIELYLKGKLSEFRTEVNFQYGTEFQKAVWKKLLEVPYGKVVTYRELAELIGKPNAARAVGNALSVNPVPIVVPCHRVLASGGIGGYGLGLDMKRGLLRIEGVPI